MMDEGLVRNHLVHLLRGRGAHRPTEEILEGVPLDKCGVRPDGLPHSLWELLEHMRRAQMDIMAYIDEPEYAAPEWPEEYWPGEPAPPHLDAWEASRTGFLDDLDTLVQWVRDPERDLLRPVPSHEEHTFLREILLVADHNAYHLGQVVEVRRLLGCWRSEQ